jgi:cyclase
MLRPRIIVCLDVDHGRVVKGRNFTDLRDVGDPVTLARRYEEEGADEIVFLDISASAEGRGTIRETVQGTAEVLFIPLTVGGGVRSLEDMGALLRAGADKICLNTAAVEDPHLVTKGADRVGSQCIVASVDASRRQDGWQVYIHGGRTPTELDAVEWAVELAQRGAGEILLTSMDQDGVRAGYDIELTRTVADRVGVPVVASGGAGAAVHLREAFTRGGASAALLAGILHDGLTTVRELKETLMKSGLNVRQP